jgi:hypothetical protein
VIREQKRNRFPGPKADKVPGGLRVLYTLGTFSEVVPYATTRAMDSNDLVRLAMVRSLARSGAARSIRLAAGLSLADVGKACGAGAPTVWRWERGVHAPTGERGLNYAELLQMLLKAHR